MNSAAASVLLEVARSLTRAGDVDELVYEILHRARDVMQCEVCSLLLPDGRTDELIIRSTRGDRGPRGALRVPAGLGISGHVFRSRQLVNVQDAASDPRHYAPVSHTAGFAAGALLTIPLMDGEDCLGVMQAINPAGRPVFDAEDEQTFLTFGTLVAATLLRLSAHAAAVREAAARREFALAHEIQASFLPRDEAEAAPFDVRAFYQPAQEVGGDFYFWQRIDDHRLLAGLGDVCGKGLAAALDMARCSALVTTRAPMLREEGLARWVTALNGQLCQILRAGRFVAATFVLFDTRRQRLEVVSAGQFPPRAFSAGKWTPLAVDSAPPLGISPVLHYHARSFPTAAASEWLLHSDGLPESRGHDGSYFGDSLFEATLGADPAPLDRLAHAWRHFAAAEGYRDDCTVLWLRDGRTPPAPVEHDCAPETMGTFREFAEKWATFAGMDAPNADLLVLATDEVVTNVYRHAYGENPGPLRLSGHVAGDDLVFTFEHRGRGCEAARLPCAQPARPDQPGGMGLGVIETAFQRVEFLNGAPCRIVLTKALVPPADD